MDMPNFKYFVIAFAVFVITDSLWLGLVAKSMYFDAYGPWLRLTNGELQLTWWAAALVYVLFTLSVVFFIAPLAGENLRQAAAYGALLGCIIYGVYNFTLLAIMKDWPIKAGLIDWAWGTFLYAWSATITLFVAHR